MSEGTKGSYPMFYLYRSIVGHFIIIRNRTKIDRRARDKFEPIGQLEPPPRIGIASWPVVC